MRIHEQIRRRKIITTHQNAITISQNESGHCECVFVCMDIIIQIKNCQWLSRIAQIFTHRDTSKHTQLNACYVCEQERKRWKNEHNRDK